MMRVTKFFLESIFALLLLLMAGNAHSYSYVKEITEAELQAKVEAMMPVKKTHYFFTVIVNDPLIKLHEANNKVSVKAALEVTAPGNIRGNGWAEISGSIRYAAQSGSFYLREPQVVDIHINQVSKELQPQIKQLAQAAISKSLSQRPLYTFNDDDLRQKLAKAVLESVTVENKTVLLKLSAF